MTSSYMKRAYDISSVSEAQSFYNGWASTYDSDMAKEAQDYVAPALATSTLLKCLGTATLDPGLQLLDAGCGTGLVGACVAKAGGRQLDGLDLSAGMLEIADKTGAYRSLKTADLTRPVEVADGAYDAVLCIGTLTQGHVGPEALDELARVTKPRGFVVVTILGKIYESGGYEAKVKSLEASGAVKVVSITMEDYRRGEGVRAWMIALQVLGQ